MSGHEYLRGYQVLSDYDEGIQVLCERCGATIVHRDSSPLKDIADLARDHSNGVCTG